MSKLTVDTFRFERKFVIPPDSINYIEHIIKQNTAIFTETFYPRFVNNIYFDTQSFRFFNENIDGVSARKKIRIRWYGDLDGEVQNPILEFKQKSGLLGIKRYYPLHGFKLGEIFKPGFFSNLFGKSSLELFDKDLLLSLTPTLINRYYRKYFQSVDQKFRITLDSDLEYFPVSSPNHFQERLLRNPFYMIMELKYDKTYQTEASDVTQQFLFRVSKNSKYVRGVSMLYDLGEHY